jgi:hypothetical protein
VARRAAIAALVLMTASVVLAAVSAVQAFPRGVSVFACVIAAVAAARWALLHRGVKRFCGASVALILLIGALLFVVLEGQPLMNALIVGLALSLAAARMMFTVHVELGRASPPTHPVLFYNPKSGGGRSERFRVADEARARGVEAIELQRDDDLATIVHEALERGADALGMASGDGSQAIVDGVVGALDAFTKGGKRAVDLAEVNGRVFVNSVSLGVYAEAVQRESYRNAKLRTLADTMPALLGPDGTGVELRWIGPDGRRCATSEVLLVSNDAYRLGRALGSGTRPRLDAGELGIAAIGLHEADGRQVHGLSEWSGPALEVESDRRVAAGIDGDAAQLDPPCAFAQDRRHYASGSRPSIRAPHPRRSCHPAPWTRCA